MDLDESLLKFELAEIKDGTDNCKFYIFKAYLCDQAVSTIDITIPLKESTKPYLRTEPFLFSMDTEEQYRGNGIVGKLIQYANDYLKENVGCPLSSGSTNKGSAPKVWEKLESDGNATRFTDISGVRWRMH